MTQALQFVESKHKLKTKLDRGEIPAIFAYFIAPTHALWHAFYQHMIKGNTSHGHEHFAKCAEAVPVERHDHSCGVMKISRGDVDGAPLKFELLYFRD